MLRLHDYRFAAVDVETTGLSPRYHHRVVEVGIVLFRLDGEIEAEYESLVNPRRDLGGTESIHGLTMAELTHAPTFDDIAADVGSLLRDRVVVAHNARFDVGFLEAEFEHSGFRPPALPYLCTMQLAGSHEHGRRLADVCARLSVLHGQAHTAIGDARAVAGILSRWYETHPQNSSLRLVDGGSSAEPLPTAWPPLTPRGIALVRGEASRRAAAERGYLGRLLDRLPVQTCGMTGDEAAYLDVLERALEDRRLSSEEVLELAWIAGAEHLSADDVRRLHREFFGVLVSTAWQDGVVTEFEAADLRLVGELLAIEAADLQHAIAVRPSHGTPLPAPTSNLAPGTTVCFTGALHATIDGVPISREDAAALATARGLRVQDSVTKKLDVLVVADPRSQSGKAQKARQYGTRIIAEATFWQMCGVRTD